MRRPVKNRNIPGPDVRYKSQKVEKLINYCMERGKKNAARSIVYDAFDIVKDKTGEDPLVVFDTAVRNVGPTLEVRSRRIGGANYQVPREVRAERRFALALRWMVAAARAKKGSPMGKKLADELLAASKNEGEAVKRRENTHKMADANKAFAHFSW